MLPPSYLDAMPDAFVQLAQQVEDEILQDVARRIGKMGTLTETADWQLWRYQQTEAVRENVVKLLAKYSGKSEATIRRLLKEAATEAMEREDAIYYHYNLEPTPFEESAALNNLLNAGARQTCGTWRNLTATTANTVSGAFERTLDVAWGKVATGAFDYKTAVKQAVDSLADEMPEITYPSGHTDSLEVAARRAVLTGVNQTAGKLQEARMDEMNVEFVETSAHGGARPSHAEWQGRRFHRGGAVDYLGKHYPDFEQATGYGTGAGLCGWNCRHTFFAVFPELGDPPTWTEESLQELNARNIEYNGKLYTQYEVNQMQRARERNVRKWKKRYLAESAAGSDTTDSAVRLKAARQSLSEFAKATGGRGDNARTSVPKFGRSEASKAGWAAKNSAQSKPLLGSEKIESSENFMYTDIKTVSEKPWLSWEKIEGGHSSASDTIASNPKFNEAIEYRRNCQKCVPTYEMRRRGYDVAAKPTFAGDELAQVKNMGAMFNGAKIENFPQGNGFEEIQQRMAEWGDGARAEVVVGFKNSAHAFVAEQKNGRTFFRDPQNGFINCRDYFSKAMDGETLLMRIDNAELNDTIGMCCEGVHHDTE